jgi:hypothetical protein
MNKKGVEKMKLKKGEKYILVKSLIIRNAYSIGTIPIGTEIEIQQVDKNNHQYLVDDTWIYYKAIENVISN